MRLLRRDTVEFVYKPLSAEVETQTDERHTGNYEPTYGYSVTYRGNISIPTGFASDNLFGQNIQYSHVLLMDNTKADIQEDGIIEWRGEVYEIRAVRPSHNFLSIALKKKTANHALLPVGG